MTDPRLFQRPCSIDPPEATPLRTFDNRFSVDGDDLVDHTVEDAEDERGTLTIKGPGRDITLLFDDASQVGAVVDALNALHDELMEGRRQAEWRDSNCMTCAGFECNCHGERRTVLR